MQEEELNAEQVDHLRALLDELQSQLAASLKSGRENVKPVELDQPSVGRLSRMDAMQHQEMARATRSQMELRLRLVQAALRSIENNNDYGSCRECGENIGFKRLSVRPEAPFCLACQSAKEQR